jgi:orotate phosphoribosyltransferase-like protein
MEESPLKKLVLANRDFHSGYLTKALSYDQIQITINKIVNRLKKEIKNGLEFNAIACCGVSGTILAGAIAAKLGVDIVVVRKEAGGPHSSWHVEGRYGDVQYVILDDLIESGSTIRYIIDEIQKENEKLNFYNSIVPEKKISVCKAIVLYDDGVFSTSKDFYFLYDESDETTQIKGFRII